MDRNFHHPFQQQQHHQHYFIGPTFVSEGERTHADVLPGRGGLGNHNPGNVAFRNIVEQLLPMYMTASTEKERLDLAKQVLHAVKQRGGRFLQELGEEHSFYQLQQAKHFKQINQLKRPMIKRWIVMEDECAIKRIKQRFYDEDKKNRNGARTAAAAAAASDGGSDHGGSTAPAAEETKDDSGDKLEGTTTTIPTAKEQKQQKQQTNDQTTNIEQKQQLTDEERAEERRRNGIPTAATMPLPGSNHQQMSYEDVRSLCDQEFQLQYAALQRARNLQLLESKSNDELHMYATNPMFLHLHDIANAILQQRLIQSEIERHLQFMDSLREPVNFKSRETQTFLQASAERMLLKQQQQLQQHATFYHTTHTLPHPPEQPKSTPCSSMHSLLSENADSTLIHSAGGTTATSMDQITMRTDTTTSASFPSRRHNPRLKGGGGSTCTGMSISSMSQLFSFAVSFNRSVSETSNHQCAGGGADSTWEVQSADGRLEAQFRLPDHIPADNQSLATTVSELDELDMIFPSAGEETIMTTTATTIGKNHQQQQQKHEESLLPVMEQRIEGDNPLTGSDGFPAPYFDNDDDVGDGSVSV